MSSSNGFTGSTQHGVISTDRVTNVAAEAFIFQGDHLGCPEGWKAYRDYCYYLPRMDPENGDNSWFAARQTCQSKGADLATIADRAEQDFLFRIGSQLLIRNSSTLLGQLIGDQLIGFFE